MSSGRRETFRALALLGAVTGAALIIAGDALAAPVLRACAEEGRRGGFSNRCDYEVYPLSLPSFNIAPKTRPDPIPPYAS